MENDKGEAAATLIEDCESDELTTDIVENNSGKDEERVACFPHQLHGFSTAAGRKTCCLKSIV